MNNKILNCTNDKMTVIYARVAGNDVVCEAVERQISELKHLAINQNLVVNKVYHDSGYSGLNFDRPGFQQMIADITSDKIGTILVTGPDRITRSSENYYSFLTILTKHNCELLWLGKSDKNPWQEFLEDMLKQVKSKRIKQGMAK